VSEAVVCAVSSHTGSSGSPGEEDPPRTIAAVCPMSALRRTANASAAVNCASPFEVVATAQAPAAAWNVLETW
jgi:hypothetical protein